MELKHKIWIEDDKGKQVFGDGVCRLLALIEDLGSINQAAKVEKMSYRQAWGKIKRIENRLKTKLLNRRIGGESGGGATLTWEGKEFLREYQKISQDIDEYMAQVSKRLNKTFESIAGDDIDRSIS
jgi:molybdate transport system regulatory protein